MFGLQIFQKGRALLVLMSVLSISSCMAQPPGPPPPPPPPREGFAPPPPPPAPEGARTALRGVVRRVNYGPAGLDGLVLDRGQIVHFPPEYANGIAGLAPIGASVSVSGWPHTGPAGDMIFDDSITNQRTGASLAVTNGPPPPPPGPPGPGRGPAPPPPPPAPAAWGPAPPQPPAGPAGAYIPAAGSSAAPAPAASHSGTIRSFNYGLDGQINGLILSDGTAVYFPPELGSQIETAVQIGGRVAVTGWPRTGYRQSADRCANDYKSSDRGHRVDQWFGAAAGAVRLKNPMHRADVRKIFIYAGTAALFVMAACGPPGPPFGLGPALDPFIGLLFLLALLLGGAWVVKSAARSPDGQTIERRISETGRSLRDRLFPGERAGESASKAREIVKEHYARGEIDRDQYLQMLKDLDEQR